MRIGVVPSKYGYVAVCLAPFDDGKWELESPVPISSEHLLQLRSQIAQRLAEWCQQLSPWHFTLPVAIPWAAWGLVVLAMYYTSLMSIAPKYIILYGWIRLFFFGDGLQVLTTTLYHLPGVLKTQKIARRLLTGNWELSGELILPYRTEAMPGESETIYILRQKLNYPDAAPFYEAMLEERPPAIFDWYPLGMAGWLRNFFLGPRYRLPPMVFEMGTLECEQGHG